RLDGLHRPPLLASPLDDGRLDGAQLLRPALRGDRLADELVRTLRVGRQLSDTEQQRARDGKNTLHLAFLRPMIMTCRMFDGDDPQRIRCGSLDLSRSPALSSMRCGQGTLHENTARCPGRPAPAAFLWAACMWEELMGRTAMHRNALTHACRSIGGALLAWGSALLGHSPAIAEEPPLVIAKSGHLFAG